MIATDVQGDLVSRGKPPVWKRWAAAAVGAVSTLAVAGCSFLSLPGNVRVTPRQALGVGVSHPMFGPYGRDEVVMRFGHDGEVMRVRAITELYGLPDGSGRVRYSACTSAAVTPFDEDNPLVTPLPVLSTVTHRDPLGFEPLGILLSAFGHERTVVHQRVTELSEGAGPSNGERNLNCTKPVALASDAEEIEVETVFRVGHEGEFQMLRGVGNADAAVTRVGIAKEELVRQAEPVSPSAQNHGHGFGY